MQDLEVEEWGSSRTLVPAVASCGCLLSRLWHGTQLRWDRSCKAWLGPMMDGSSVSYFLVAVLPFLAAILVGLSLNTEYIEARWMVKKVGVEVIGQARERSYIQVMRTHRRDLSEVQCEVKPSWHPMAGLREGKHVMNERPHLHSAATVNDSKCLESMSSKLRRDREMQVKQILYARNCCRGITCLVVVDADHTSRRPRGLLPNIRIVTTLSGPTLSEAINTEVQ